MRTTYFTILLQKAIVTLFHLLAIKGMIVRTKRRHQVVRHQVVRHQHRTLVQLVHNLMVDVCVLFEFLVILAHYTNNAHALHSR